LENETNITLKRCIKGIANGMPTVIMVGLLIAPVAISAAPQGAQPAAGAIKESALATVQEMARAMLENDAAGTVVSTPSPLQRDLSR
jgi:hypothetical protein